MNSTILIVDDEEKIRSIVSNYLKQEGFEIQEVSSGQEALQQLKHSGDYDLVILDWTIKLSPAEATRYIG